MATREETTATDGRSGGSWREVLGAFLRLGLTSFGGPVAHLGYFREEFVHRRRWLDDKSYADLVALCQFLPGPASSQVGLAVGLLRGGYAGALAAWIGFTLPSAVAMVAFGYGIGALGNAAGSGWLHGLKVAAVAVVAQAVLGMARTLAPDRARATLAVAAAIIALGAPSSWGQIGAIVLGGIAKRADAVAEGHHGDRRRQRESDPGRQGSGIPAAQQADGETHLARGRPGQELAERDQIGVAVIVEPAPPVHELLAEIAEMRHRSAEGGQPEPKEHA